MMGILEFLVKSGVNYESSEHIPVFSAQEIAAIEHEPGKYVAKPVIIKADDHYVMCVLPACRNVDLMRLKCYLSAELVDLASETEIANLFPDCELGAEPPFGNLYDLPTIMDKALEKDDHILFQAGHHDKAIRISMADYLKLVEPRIHDFSYSVSF